MYHTRTLYRWVTNCWQSPSRYLALQIWISFTPLLIIYRRDFIVTGCVKFIQMFEGVPWKARVKCTQTAPQSVIVRHWPSGRGPCKNSVTLLLRLSWEPSPILTFGHILYLTFHSLATDSSVFEQRMHRELHSAYKWVYKATELNWTELKCVSAVQCISVACGLYQANKLAVHFNSVHLCRFVQALR